MPSAVVIVLFCTYLIPFQEVTVVEGQTEGVPSSVRFIMLGLSQDSWARQDKEFFSNRCALPRVLSHSLGNLNQSYRGRCVRPEMQEY